jgi:hypothetical protein
MWKPYEGTENPLLQFGLEEYLIFGSESFDVAKMLRLLDCTVLATSKGTRRQSVTPPSGSSTFIT